MANTTCKILKCECNHSMQDKMHGPQMRVFNPMLKENEYRCTICCKTKTSAKK